MLESEKTGALNPDFTKAEKSALQILEDNFIVSPPVPVEELIEFAGLGIVRSDFDDGEISGVINLEKKYLYINAKDSPERQRFTIAHELGHWILHRKEMESNKEMAVLYRRSIGTKENDVFEQEANFFAANLLVPEKMFLKVYQEEQNKTVQQGGFIVSDAVIAKIFEVSRSVIGYRRQSLGMW